MENSDIVVGLDIGTTKICTLVGRKNEFGKIEILGHGRTESLGVTRGVVTNIVAIVVKPHPIVMRMIVFLAPIFCSSRLLGTSKKK